MRMPWDGDEHAAQAYERKHKLIPVTELEDGPYAAALFLLWHGKVAGTWYYLCGDGGFMRLYRRAKTKRTQYRIANVLNYDDLRFGNDFVHIARCHDRDPFVVAYAAWRLAGENKG